MAGNKTGWIMLYSCWKGTFLRSWRPRTTFNSWGISSMATPSMQWAAVKTWRLEAGKYHTKPKLRRYFDIRLPPQWCVPLCIFSKDTWNIMDESSRQVATCQGCLLGSLSWPPTILDPLLESSTSSLPQRQTWYLVRGLLKAGTKWNWPLDQLLQAESRLLPLCTHSCNHSQVPGILGSQK